MNELWYTVRGSDTSVVINNIIAFTGRHSVVVDVSLETSRKFGIYEWDWKQKCCTQLETLFRIE